MERRQASDQEKGRVIFVQCIKISSCKWRKGHKQMTAVLVALLLAEGSAWL